MESVEGYLVLERPKFSKWVLVVYDLGTIFIWDLFVNEHGGQAFEDDGFEEIKTLARAV